MHSASKRAAALEHWDRHILLVQVRPRPPRIPLSGFPNGCRASSPAPEQLTVDCRCQHRVQGWTLAMVDNGMVVCHTTF